jgi:hypothetical protein
MPVRCSVVWQQTCGARHLMGLTTAALATATLTGCGSGDSTVSTTPPSTASHLMPGRSVASQPGPPAAAAPTTTMMAGPADPCATTLAAPAIARAVSEMPRDPRSRQPWNPEPLAGNYNECAQLSAVIVKANTNAKNPNTTAVMFHLGKYIPHGVPDTFGFNGIDTSQCTGDTVALTYSSGVNGLVSVAKFHWNGNAVALIGNTEG